MDWWPESQAPLEDRLQELGDHADDPDWHPEWRIPPGEPQDFCGSLDRTVPALAALGLVWDLNGPRYAGDLAGVVVRADPWPPATDADVSDLGQPAAIATALVRAALRVLGEVTPDAREAGTPPTRA